MNKEKMIRVSNAAIEYLKELNKFSTELDDKNMQQALTSVSDEILCYEQSLQILSAQKKRLELLKSELLDITLLSYDAGDEFFKIQKRNASDLSQIRASVVKDATDINNSFRLLNSSLSTFETVINKITSFYDSIKLIKTLINDNFIENLVGVFRESK